MQNGNARHLVNHWTIGGGMAYFFRLIGFLLVLSFPCLSFAVTPVGTQEFVCYSPLGYFPSKLSACGAFEAYKDVNSPTYTWAVSPDSTNTQCYLDSTKVSTGAFQSGAAGCTYGSRSAVVCPANATVSGSSCTCNEGYTENSDSTSCLPVAPPCEPPNVLTDGVCGPPEPPKCNYPPGAGMPDTLFQMGGGANYKGGYICYLNCEAVPDMRGQKDGVWFHWGPYTSTGATCLTGSGDATGGQPTPDNPDGVPPPSDPDAPPRDPPPPPPEPPPEQCKKGTCPGSINGTTVCMPCSETRSPPPIPNAPPKKPDAPKDPTGNNAPPDTQNTSQSATNCKDGKCTTTTTTSTTDSAGVTTTNSHTKTESKDDFCTSNPRSAMCAEGVFGGACTGGFTCEGDAVQCAIAKEQHVRNCKLFEDFSSDEAQLYQSESSKDGNIADDLPGNETITIGPQSFDTSNAFGGGAVCISDKNITVMGQSITLPFSNICPYLAILGNILMSVSFLLGARILTRG